MAKLPSKKESAAQPQVHRLALPVSDESLVIDLPDGQKLVVGKLATGSVIEVATWRGTGRPDSRTTRLMLGMSNASATNEAVADGSQAVADSEESAQGVAALAAKFQGLIAGIKFPKRAAKPEPEEVQEVQEVQEIADVSQNQKSEKPAKRSPWSAPTPADETSGEADKWLEEIMARTTARESTSGASAKKAVAPAKKAVAPAKKAPARKPVAKKSVATARKSAGKNSGRSR
jgi:hypothetical protein